MTAFLLYVALFLLLAFWDAREVKTASGFFINSQQSSRTQVSFSLIASCVGGSATIGMCGLAYQVGMPAFWWLGSGAIGLAVLTLFLAKKVRNGEALTMPEMVKRDLGAPAHKAITLTIFIAWIAILAAQFVAMSQVIDLLTGWGTQNALIAGALFIVTYTLLGGQTSVMKSDVLQLIVMIVGLLLLLFYVRSDVSVALQRTAFEFTNESFGLSKVTYFLLLLGGSYVVCPMLFSRFMSAKNEKVAVQSGWIAVVGLFLMTTLIVVIGLAAQSALPAGVASDKVLMELVGMLPLWGQTLLLLALMSAILSSADSCLITAATVLSNDLFRRPTIGFSRLCIVVIGALGLLLSYGDRGILGLLLMANNIYVCGVVAPVFVAMVSGKAQDARWVLVAVVVGGALGLVSEVTQVTTVSYVAILLSIVISIIAMRQGKQN